MGTEALRVETEEASDARLESFRPREMPERFLSREPISNQDATGEATARLWTRKGGNGGGTCRKGVIGIEASGRNDK